MKIWCLFSVENNYDQPENNLVSWWQNKPTIETLTTFVGICLGKSNDEAIVQLVNLWSKGDCRHPLYGTIYRLEEVEEGKKLG